MMPTPDQARAVRLARRWAVWAGREHEAIAKAMGIGQNIAKPIKSIDDQNGLCKQFRDEVDELLQRGLHGRHHAQVAGLVTPPSETLAERLSRVTDDADEQPEFPPEIPPPPAPLVLSLALAPAAPPATCPVVELARAA